LGIGVFAMHMNPVNVGGALIKGCSAKGQDLKLVHEMRDNSQVALDSKLIRTIMTSLMESK
jgi:hypothetical protein